MAMPRKWPRGYYAYVMCWPNGIPYYVGAGKNNRANPMLKKLGGGRCIERELRLIGETTIVEIYETKDRPSAFRLEKRLIKKYGRLNIGTGSLFNLTDGLGSDGLVWSHETREKLALQKRGKKLPLKTRLKMSVKLMGNKHLLGHIHSKETRMKLKAASIRRRCA
jgi:hypothetical protein